MAEREPSPFEQILTEDPLPDYLGQGDIAVDFGSRKLPVPKPPTSSWILLSNTCDLVQREKMSYMSVAPVYELHVWVEDLVLEKLRRAKDGDGVPGYDSLVKRISKKLHTLANYEDKRLFFLPPHRIFGESAAFTSLEQTGPLPISRYENFRSSRVASMLSPWREKLGYKIGYLFGRVATPTPDRSHVQDWVKDVYGAAIKKIMKS